MDDTRRPAIEVGTVTNENTERLLTPHQVAEMFRVDPKTVARWASNGRIGSIRTPGGHRRFRESEVRALLAERDRARRVADRLTASTANRRGGSRAPSTPAAAPVPHRRNPCLGHGPDGRARRRRR